MKAVVFKGTPTGAIIKVTSSAICGTDLHIYDGRTGATPGLVLGHEPLWVIVETGSAVELVKPGDRVVAPGAVRLCGDKLLPHCVRPPNGRAESCIEKSCI